MSLFLIAIAAAFVFEKDRGFIIESTLMASVAKNSVLCIGVTTTTTTTTLYSLLYSLYTFKYGEKELN